MIPQNIYWILSPFLSAITFELKNVVCFNQRIIEVISHPKKLYFYGVRIHLLITKDGIPVEWAFIPGEANEVRGFDLLPFNLPPGSEVYADKAFNHYDVEDCFEEFDQIQMKVIRKKNSCRSDAPWVQYIKQCTRHFIETVFSQITNKFPKFIHAVTIEGLLLKVSSFIFSFTLERSFL